LAFTALGISIIGLGVTILIHSTSLLGNSSIGTGIAAVALGVTITLFIMVPIVMDLFTKEGRGGRFINSLISG
jgi:hypothetical protein